MSEHENEGPAGEPGPADDLRQGDLLFNVPIALMPQEPRFVLGTADQVATQTLPDYPEHAPLIVVEARFGVLSMVVTPTCHVSEGEKDEDIVAVVPVEALSDGSPKSKLEGQQETPGRDPQAVGAGLESGVAGRVLEAVRNLSLVGSAYRISATATPDSPLHPCGRGRAS